MQDLPEPRPRLHPQRYDPAEWPDGSCSVLPPRSEPLTIDLCDLLEVRQTRRDFAGAPSLEQLGAFLWLSARSRSNSRSPYGFDQESRTHPSAGALHPVHTLINETASTWQRYDPISHSLIELRGSSVSAAVSRAMAREIIDLGSGCLIALVGEHGKTGAKYEHPETLVWRDAGVLLGYMSIVAEALGLAFCPLGTTGQAALVGALPKGQRLQGVGLAILGVG